MNTEQEIVYENKNYRVEKIGIKKGDEIEYVYGVINNKYNVLEVELPVLIQALKAADEVSDTLDAFWKTKAFVVESDSKVIETA
jgi:hypothetical protein